MKKGFMLLAVLGLFAFAVIEAPARSVSETNIQTSIEAPAVDNFIAIERVSVFFPEVEQTDSNPLQTASGAEIDLELLACGELKWIAVSRDLHVRYGGKLKFGDSVHINTGDPAIDGRYIVHDLMNKRYRKAIDILLPSGSRQTLVENILISV